MKKAPFDNSIGKKNHISMGSMGKKEVPKMNMHSKMGAMSDILAKLEQKKHNALERK